MRCTAGIRISEDEYTRIVAVLRAQKPSYARAVLEQPKELPWFEAITYTACLFLDIDTRLCLIYPARPLICRLFGHIAHLPCPTGQAPADPGADARLAAYTRQPLKTFQEWMAGHGVGKPDDLLTATD